MIIKKKPNTFLSKVMTTIGIIMITLLIVFYEENPIASIVFGSIILSLMLIRIEQSFEIKQDEIVVTRKNKLFRSSKKFTFNSKNVKQILYYKKNYLNFIIPTPGFRLKSEILWVELKDSEIKKFILSVTSNEYESLIKTINKINKSSA